MAKPLSGPSSALKPPETCERKEILKKNHYFDNEIVERLLYRYLEGACTNVHLRDEIMEHASELIRQVIKAHNLSQIYPGKDDSSYGDLFQTAWCVAADTFVFSENGIQTIQKVVNDKQKKLYGLEGLQSIKNYLVKELSDTLKIKTKLGYNIECTPDHPLYVMGNDGPIWKKAGELKNGDLLAIQYNQQYFVGDNDISNIKISAKGKEDWNPGNQLSNELAYFIGLYVSEGSHSHNRVTIYNVDQEVIDFLVRMGFKNEPKYQRTAINCVRLSEFLDKIGLTRDIKANAKFIPDIILRASKDRIVSFLRGYFDGDGHSSRCGGFVGCTSISLILIKQLRMLLNNFGIISKLSISKRRRSTFNKKNKLYISKTQIAYQIALSTDNSMKFYDIIGFNIVRKQIKRMQLSSCSFGDLLYGLTERFKRLHVKFGNGLGRYKSIKKFVAGIECFAQSASIALPLYKDCQDDVDYKFIKNRLDEYYAQRNNIIWLPITGIQTSQAVTYDVEIPVGRSFIADCIVSSNCQVESALYKYEARPHCSKCYNLLRPNDSLLVDKFIFADEAIAKIGRCRNCKTKLLTRSDIYYRGKSRVFNMWSQVSRTVILAYIKKENRDRKNSHVFQAHLGDKVISKPSHALDRFMTEAEQICKYNKEYLVLIEAIRKLYEKDDRAHEGLIAKLVEQTKLPRITVTSFLRMIRLRSLEFTDAPVNEEIETIGSRFAEADQADG